MNSIEFLYLILIGTYGSSKTSLQITKVPTLRLGHLVSIQASVPRSLIQMFVLDYYKNDSMLAPLACTKKSHTNVCIGFLVQILRKIVGRRVYTRKCSKKGGVIGEPWFPIPVGV